MQAGLLCPAPSESTPGDFGSNELVYLDDARLHVLTVLQSPPAVASAGEAAPYPPALPADAPSMVARAQDILVLLSGPQMQLESTRVRLDVKPAVSWYSTRLH